MLTCWAFEVLSLFSKMGMSYLAFRIPDPADPLSQTYLFRPRFQVSTRLACEARSVLAGRRCEGLFFLSGSD